MADAIEFRVLGRVEAWRGGTRLELGGPKQRAVLASLLLRAGRVVSQDQLVDDLWPDDPPARATATVQVFVSNLRRALEPDRPRGTPARVLVTEAPGYRLAVAADAVDAHVFTDLLRRARESDEPDEVARLLGAAAALWRGPALSGLPDAPFARTEAARLEELRLGAAEDHAEAELALGHHADQVAGLERRVRTHPLRERSRAQLMLALHRCGREAEALEVYRDGRRVLADELGLEPGARLRALEQAILRQDPALTWAPPRVVLPAPAAEPTADEPGRVLVVDDSGLNRRLLVTALTELGHTAHAVADGEQALEALAGAEYDVVLLDLLMPVLDGYTTLAEIKADPATAHLPVIMVSAVQDMDSVVRCIELGATDYLPKPFGAAILRARLRSSLAAKRLRDAEREGLRRLVEEREAALQAEIDALRREVQRGRIGA
ncbi:BTAD domain-containing putative transcriptional regulator [Pseudonocardia sp. WMMC193]|uniref:BTAD domain-containing putative transcriptional regulator n=1 Tax=Pseudonocardia sp. WMMC193 TaxID=2911965 RepID=UPI001F01F510|nr:BTAD domain-containing putative transcriptional regulator [Pseudonocardia sp. WMMC193]MCF7548688.1 response regulator [Pseudonocardia sp. WMMC193]